MTEDPRNRPGPPRRPRRPSGGTRRGGAPAGSDPRSRPDGPGRGRPVVPRRTRPVLILPGRNLPAGVDPADLAALLVRLRRDPATRVRPIGGEADPEALAATLTEDQIADLTRELGDRATVVEDTPIDL